MQLTVTTFNVQHFRDYHYPQEDRIDIPFFAKYIAAKNADIVGLNEVFNSGKTKNHEKQAYVLAKNANYPYVYFAEAIKLFDKYSYGNAMISKYPFKGERILIPDPAESELNGKYAETRCVLKADFNFNNKKLTLLTCHFGLNDAEARNAVNTVCQIAKTCPNPLLLMGDFNQGPASPVLKRLFEEFIDTEDLLGRDSKTFPSDNPTEKIDYIFVRGDIRVLSANVNNDVVSDHFSITAKIEF